MQASHQDIRALRHFVIHPPTSATDFPRLSCWCDASLSMGNDLPMTELFEAINRFLDRHEQCFPFVSHAHEEQSA